MGMPQRVRIVEVGPRDGLQNEPAPVTPAVRIQLIERLADAGLTCIEAGAFVSPARVPQMADSGEVLKRLRRRTGVSYPVLVPNEQGLAAALAAGAERIALFAAASESFSHRNIHCGIADALDRYQTVAQRARRAGLRLRGYVSCALGCPYEGAIRPAAVAEVARRLYRIGCDEVSLGDTLGIGTPRALLAVLERVAMDIPIERIAVHCHDTYGQALANIYAALQAGVAVIDSSVAGLGGCPYAKGATGNVATEEVVYLLHGLGIETGVSLVDVARAGRFISAALGREPNSRVNRALLARGDQ